MSLASDTLSAHSAPKSLLPFRAVRPGFACGRLLDFESATIGGCALPAASKDIGKMMQVRFVVAFCALAMTSPALCGAVGYRVFITNEGSGDLTVVDGATNQVTATWPLGKRP